jgi:hypothetical protein
MLKAGVVLSRHCGLIESKTMATKGQTYFTHMRTSNMQWNNLIELQAQYLPRAKPGVKVPTRGAVVNAPLCETVTLLRLSKAISLFFLSSSLHYHHLPSLSRYPHSPSCPRHNRHHHHHPSGSHQYLCPSCSRRNQDQPHIESCFHTINNTYPIAQNGRARAAHGLRLADRDAADD